MPGVRGKGMAKKAKKMTGKKTPAKKKTGMRGGGMVPKKTGMRGGGMVKKR